jgi:hypothetical protein
MTIYASLIREQEVTFAVVIVPGYAMQTDGDAERARGAYQRFFPDVPLILAAENSNGEFRFQGRADIVKYLVSIRSSQIPWRQYYLPDFSASSASPTAGDASTAVQKDTDEPTREEAAALRKEG